MNFKKNTTVEHEQITQQEINDTLQEVLKYCGLKIKGVDDKGEFFVDINLGFDYLSFSLDKDRQFSSRSSGRYSPIISQLTPTPALLFIAEKILDKDRYKKITPRTSAGKILSLIKEKIWDFIIDDNWYNDLLISGIYYPSGDIKIATEIENSYDTLKYYSASQDGSGNFSNCWNFDGTDYPKGTFDSVLTLAKELRKKETKWQKFINRIFHYSSYKFSHHDCLLLLDEINSIKRIVEK
ncbi:MAG: hypothetical protein PHC34_01645 [Candidatus Gastranaerophilales bacterium]|nr:hypothetical protein [Candidatus Gastranaerophilales bacterium]